MQKATPNIIHYFARSEWEQFQDKGVHMAMDYLITRLLQLGYKNVSEPCMAWCASLMLYLAKLGNSPQNVKQQVLTHFKNEYHIRSRRAQCVGEVPLTLPMPEMFMAERPDLFHKVFPVEKPIPSLIDLSIVDLPMVQPRPSRKDSLALSLLGQPGPATQPQLQIVEQMLSLQQANMQLLQSSVGSRNLMPCSLQALAAPPMAALQDQVRHRLEVPSSSSASLEIPVGLGEPRQDDLGEPRQDAPQGDSEAGVQTVRGQSQHADLGEAIIAMPEDDTVGEPTSPISAPALAAFPLALHDAPSNEKLMLADAQGQDSLNPSDSQVVAVGPSSNPAERAIEVAPTGLAQRLLDDMEHMERAKAQATSKAKQEAKAKAKALAGNTKAKALAGKAKAKALAGNAKAKATGKAKGKAKATGQAKASASAQAIGEAKGEAKAKASASASAKAKANAKEPGAKRYRSARIENEGSIMTIRARIPDGPSKGFRYTCVADMERARKEAEEYIRVNS